MLPTPKTSATRLLPYRLIGTVTALFRESVLILRAVEVSKGAEVIEAEADDDEL